MKILYIDDDCQDRDIFRDAVRSINPSIEFDYAGSCEEALFKLKSKRLPNIIFLDINMPLRDGKECLKIIKTNPLLKSLLVIVYSTSNDPADIKECIELGASDYLVKPRQFNDLCNKLKPWLTVAIK